MISCPLYNLTVRLPGNSVEVGRNTLASPRVSVEDIDLSRSTSSGTAACARWTGSLNRIKLSTENASVGMI